MAPRCLDCPLPRCRYDDPGGLRGLLNESRNAQVLQARLSGQTVDEIARRFGVSRRSVFRILRQERRPAAHAGAKRSRVRRARRPAAPPIGGSDE